MDFHIVVEVNRVNDGRESGAIHLLHYQHHELIRGESLPKNRSTVVYYCPRLPGSIVMSCVVVRDSPGVDVLDVGRYPYPATLSWQEGLPTPHFVDVPRNGALMTAVPLEAWPRPCVCRFREIASAGITSG